MLHLPFDINLGIGAFISAVINFIILAFVLFCMLKAMNKLMDLGKHEEEKPAEPLFTPNIPASENLVVEAAEAPAGANGISVGEELGGQVVITARPKRNRRAKAVNQESGPTAETPAVEA